MEDETRNENIKNAATFFFVLAILTVLAWILPLRPSYSQDEKRELAAFPDYDMHALLSGSYYRDIDAWFSDTFTGREMWLAVGETIRSLYGTGDVTIYGEIGHSDPMPTAEPVQSDKPEPEPVATPVPSAEPEVWKGNVVGEDNFIEFGTVLQMDDACYEYFYYYEAGAKRHADLMTRAQALVGDRARVFCILPPSAICVMFEQSYLDRIGNANVQEVTDFIYDNCVGVTPVDAFGALLRHNDEYLFFRTDHHWTATAAYYVYEEYCRTAGLTPAPLDSFREEVYKNFTGSLYAYVNRANMLRADEVHAYIPPGDIEMLVTNEGGTTYDADVVADASDYAENSKYLCFIQGDNPITKITNESCENENSCLLVKDSFGNCFAPFLTQNYRTVYVVDYRSYRYFDLSGLVDMYGIDDVIFLNNLTLCQADITADDLGELIG